MRPSAFLLPGGRLLICNFSNLALPGNVADRTEDLILRHNPGWPKAGWRGVHPQRRAPVRNWSAHKTQLDSSLR